ncbi:hypothetical protein [Chryseobacterium taihuense]|uniref:Lipoprotein n=1 Tax=Chryseobacterium taihuense TaxID=1141221 RepID=A0ABY0QWI9_9FLAO|nr:hypothetical protein [Chryseobacterium taihuense]SDM02562.1 hypothetical protein SAMN05216273_1115 [Chryseobacterium taihuense]
MMLKGISGIKIHIVGKMKLIINILILLVVFSCKKQEKDLLQVTELDSYKIVKTKINDSIYKIYGTNRDYTIDGSLNILNNSKQDWWIIKNNNNNEKYLIEYIFLDKEIINQIKIYEKEILQKELSMYYDYTLTKQKFLLKIYYPKTLETIDKISFQYIIGDTIKKMRTSQGKVKCKFEDGSYQCQIPINENENAISGIASIFTHKNEEEDVTLGSKNIYVKTKK